MRSLPSIVGQTVCAAQNKTGASHSQPWICLLYGERPILILTRFPFTVRLMFEDLFQVYQGNANCCARNHRSADGHHLECDKHRVATTLVGLYGMMLVEAMRLRGSSLYNEDRQKQSFLEPRHGMFQHFLSGVAGCCRCAFLVLLISKIEGEDGWIWGCVSQRSFAKCWSSSERACFQQHFSTVAFKRCTSTWMRLAWCNVNTTWLEHALDELDELDVIIAMWFWLFWMHQQKK